MDLSFNALEPEYTRRLTTAKLLKPESAKVIVETLLTHKARFMAVQTSCGVPALWLMPVWAREANDINDFSEYFGNGDPIDKPTVDVPVGRGPFDSWEAGCADALKVDDVAESGNRWTWEYAAWHWEKWNGWGPREYHGRPSGYLWSWTDQYRGGKYTSDGEWSPGTWDRQAGTVILAKQLALMDAEIAKGFVS